MSKIEALRKKIARNYCRSILWVDDEIRLTRDEIDPAYYERYRNFFLPTATAIQAEGVLCQLQSVSYSDDPDEEPEELGIVKQLSKVADAVILDWHLASKLPTHSISIINYLQEVKETRFVLIVTQHSDAISEFRKEFGENLSEIGDTFDLKNGTHLAFLEKPKKEDGDFALTILSAIEHLMSVAYPDYIHWAALEIAGDIKKFAPQWLESLPRGMDWALLSEYCHGKETTAELLVENLLEDLSHCIRPSKLESTHPENCKGVDWSELKRHLAKPHGLEAGVELSLLSLDENPPKIRDGLPDTLANPTNDLLKDFVDSQKLFNTFCENVSPGTAGFPEIAPGSVFQKSGTTGMREIFVCVSQACDCLWSGELLFVRGKKEKAPKLGSTVVKFQQQCYRFDAEGKNLSILKITKTKESRLPDGLVKIGQLRAATTRRLAARFWNYATRSAVNHSEYARAERRGE